MSPRKWRRRIARKRMQMQYEVEAISRETQSMFDTVAEMRAAVDSMIGVGTESLIVRPGIEKVRLRLPAWETCPTGTGRVMVRVR